MAPTTAADLLVEEAPGELIDSMPARQDPTALRSRLFEHGYVFFRSLLPGTAVDELRAALGAVLVEHGVVAGVGLTPVPPVPVAGEEAFWRLYAAMLGRECLHRLAHHEALVGLARDLTGEADVVVHPRKMVRLGLPHRLAPRATTPAHQDYPYTQGGVDGMAMWLPLTPAPRVRGGLAVLDGSARGGLRPVRVGGDDYACVPAELDGTAGRARRWISTDFAPGDVLVFHGLTLHASLPNRTDAVRLSVDYRYRGISQPIGLTETWPPFHPFLGWWDELARDWATRRWIELPPGTRVVGVRRPQRGLHVPASTLVGAAASVLAPQTLHGA